LLKEDRSSVEMEHKQFETLEQAELEPGLEEEEEEEELKQTMMSQLSSW